MATMTRDEAKKALKRIDASMTVEDASWVQAYPEDGQLFLHGEIGPGQWGFADAPTVKKELDRMRGNDVTLLLNTPGGSVDEGIAIYNALKRYKGTVTTVVDSLAASMGSYLLQAGDERIVYANSMLMIHQPWGGSIGNSEDFRREAGVLDKYAQRMIPVYAQRTGNSVKQIESWMAAETWFLGQEIVDAGFADVLATASGEWTERPGVAAVKRKLAAVNRSFEGIAAKYPRRRTARSRAAKVGRETIACAIRGL